ncbi:tRNA (adenosine(37)-N6)-threonylcarbamoyltransferase complex dimerization subunit type 1 TsaB [Acholeplasma sp. OttesenSCG-928-E16]|nr:tRNA (adenosine(37)-N6)-threonylcarbamoyltransferase complex dimerization subunit type 1 TsaB [Acholeplasma sp. OttesenSCG-928-E16]
MKYLLMDTATNIMYIALINNKKIEYKKTRIAKRDHSKYLIDYIQKLLEEAKVDLGSLDGIIVGEGPGSYTGLRIAGVVAKTFSYTKKIPLYKVSSLFLLTSGYQNVVAMIDARNDYVFGAIYHKNENIIKDNHFKKEELLKYANDEDIIMIDENNFKINAEKIINKMVLVDNPHSYIPNYINKTEAERNANK